MSTLAQLEAVGARAREELAVARRSYRRRRDPAEPAARRPADLAADTRGGEQTGPESLPRLMVPVELDRVGPCSPKKPCSPEKKA